MAKKLYLDEKLKPTYSEQDYLVAAALSWGEAAVKKAKDYYSNLVLGGMHVNADLGKYPSWTTVRLSRCIFRHQGHFTVSLCSWSLGVELEFHVWSLAPEELISAADEALARLLNFNPDDLLDDTCKLPKGVHLTLVPGMYPGTSHASITFGDSLCVTINQRGNRETLAARLKEYKELVVESYMGRITLAHIEGS